MRWLRNLAVYFVLMAAFALVLGIAGAVTSRGADLLEAVAALAFSTVWLGTAGLFASLPFLIVVEFLLRRGQNRRL
jgi:hypothetical protein